MLLAKKEEISALRPFILNLLKLEEIINAPYFRRSAIFSISPIARPDKVTSIMCIQENAAGKWDSMANGHCRE